MKRGIVIFWGFILGGATTVYAQEPVQWTYTYKVLAPDTYEVRIIATIQDGWHLYAQKQPESAIAVPTKINFVKNPIMELQGATKEVGKMDRFIDPNLGIQANQYLHKVDFVQVIKMKARVAANISGTIQFQVCNEHECLPPAVTEFSIPLKG